MEQKIKEIRIKLDDLAFLTRKLKPKHTFIIDTALLPDNYSLDEIMEYMDKEGKLIIDSKGQEYKPYIIENNQFVDKAVDSLQLSKMWLGKVLKELGVTNPYLESKNPTNEKIEPAADTSEWIMLPVILDSDPNNVGVVLTWQKATHIQRVKWLRARIEEIENSLKEYLKSPFKEDSTLPRGVYLVTSSPEAYDCYKNSVKYSIEAGMWLGMELGRIRDLEQKDK